MLIALQPTTQIDEERKQELKQKNYRSILFICLVTFTSFYATVKI